MLNNYSILAKRYALENFQGTVYLAFRDISSLISEHTNFSNKIEVVNVLDYGCGSGRSTLFLKKLGFQNTIGVDINEEMIQQAKLNDENGHYFLIKSGKIPLQDKSVPFVFSSLVLFEIKSIDEIAQVLKEIYRILSVNGIFIIITGTIEVYDDKHTWLSVETDFPQNKTANSGDIVKILLKNSGTLLLDYYWTEQDYEEAIKKTKFKILKKLKPLGHLGDGFDWRSESKISPFLIYVLGKQEVIN